ncbi:hypothetical protein [Streptomyces sp. NPDC016675]|uniref:hypothetical protein n=1 Tax=Streptomyces sp. NPDC016675 TaxID=3364970 RepID=UPI00370227F1
MARNELESDRTGPPPDRSHTTLAVRAAAAGQLGFLADADLERTEPPAPPRPSAPRPARPALQLSFTDQEAP